MGDPAEQVEFRRLAPSNLVSRGVFSEPQCETRVQKRQHTMRRTVLLSGVTAVLMLAIASAAPQSSPQKPTFEVTSVKPNRSGNPAFSNGFQACRFVGTNATVKTMLMFAYRLPNRQAVPNNRVFGGPNWIETDRFDVEAKPESGTESMPLDAFLLMVQSLLEDRFQLRVHWDKRDLPVYNLVIGKRGLKMKKSENQTQSSPVVRNPVLPCSRSAIPTNPPLPPAGSQAARPRGPISIDYEPPAGVSITANAVSIPTLLGVIYGYMDRPIINRTNLVDLYDFKLKFSRDPTVKRSSEALARPSSSSAGQQISLPSASDPSGPSLFTAIQDLGLRFESSKAALDVLVIDSAQRPLEN